jgi:hypothetical protein
MKVLFTVICMLTSNMKLVLDRVGNSNVGVWKCISQLQKVSQVVQSGFDVISKIDFTAAG